jgi:hypothetical protein
VSEPRQPPVPSPRPVAAATTSRPVILMALSGAPENLSRPTRSLPVPTLTSDALPLLTQSCTRMRVDLRNVRGTLFVLAEEQGQPRLGSSSGWLS